MKKILTIINNLFSRKNSDVNKLYNFSVENADSMQGAGVFFRNKQYVTHTTLHHSKSAIKSFTIGQKQILFLILFLAAEGIFLNPLLSIQIGLGLLSLIYLIDVIFNLFIILKSFYSPKEITFSQKELDELDEKSLPVYSILCPLYREVNVLSQFIESMSSIDYPKDKLQIILLLEEDDTETIKKAKEFLVPRYFKGAVVPITLPKTKPKACNYGLTYAEGEYVVVYDAEDVPDPLQLKKSVLAFRKADEDVICLQAKLNYYNPNQNLLTRLFTAEYSLWFDVMLTGLQSLNSFIPLGGTSNHFKTSRLKELEGWDAFNVTEDADLGIRLFKKGYKTAIIDSTTLEEANSDFKNWLKQRSRWIKGYMQTYLVHTRDLSKSEETKGIHKFIFHLLIGGKISFIFINPILWLTTIAYFTLTPFVGSQIQALYPAPVLYLALPSLVIGNFLFFYYYMLGCAKREQWWLIKYIIFAPIYWLMISTAACISLFQLIFKPHFWEKTAHGLHLGWKQPTFAFSFWQNAYLAIVFILDIALAKLILLPSDAEKFILFSLAIKAITIVIAIATRFLGKEKFYRLIFWTFFFQWLVFTITLTKNGLNNIILYESFYSFAWICFAIVNIFVFYHWERKKYSFAFVSVIVALLQTIFFVFFNQNINIIATGIAYLGTLNLITVTLLHINKNLTTIIENNINSFLRIFKKAPTYKNRQNKKLNILIFNWRDTKHKYAGGAEIYIHELAKRWVKNGNQVTIFCGNDNRSPVNENIDGIEIVRRGGTYTVYVFAFLYYITRFRGKYDVIIDSENGIPFFSPLYSNVPKFLLIHHVHQEIFKKHLIAPLAILANILESKLMPVVYRNTQIITVSESSKQEILKLGFGKNNLIKIIHPGIDNNKFSKMEKTTHPSFLYLGRLQAYKNIDIAIKAFAMVHKQFSNAIFSIAGSGEDNEKLKKLAIKLNLENNVIFSGKVSENTKKILLAKSWVAIQPSMMEGFGLTIIEANACGTPVIASNVNGLKDSVIDKKTGILIETRDVDSLTEAMLSIINSPDVREYLSTNAYEWSKNFSWDKSTDDFYLEIIQLLNSKSTIHKAVSIQFSKNININI